ncbi:S8 family serine peptidase [Candidatus Fermentibacteria bacterium]|nr:S8 family serine peptidase [Candidatus Fermentibacteria bacterium]
MSRFVVLGLVVALLGFAVAPAGASDVRSDPVLGSTILLHSGTLEPTRVPVSVPEAWRGVAAAEYDYFIVLLFPPASRAERQALRDMGAELIDYLPHNAYIIRLPLTSLRALESSSVVWFDLWHPWFKLPPNLHGRDGSMELNIVLHPGEDASPLAQWLDSQGFPPAAMRLGPDQWLIRVTFPATGLASVAARREVQWIEENLPIHLFNQNAQWVTQSFAANSRPIWDAGLTGTDQIIEVNDSGVRTTHCAFVDPAVPITDFGVYPTHRKIVAYLDGTPMGNGSFGDEYDPYPPYGHGTHVACSVAGDDDTWTIKDGMAKTAKLVVTDVGTAGGLYCGTPYSMFYSASLHGAKIHNCSWGNDSEGSYGTNDASCDSYMWYYPFELASVAAGNNPPNFYVGSPACAKSVLCVGASRNSTNGNLLAYFSARGPTADGRHAPTFLTPGENISSAANNSDTGYAMGTGTSMSSPIAAGSAALVRSYYMNGYYPSGSANPSDGFLPLNSLLKGTMVASTRDAIDFAPPNDRTGWGFVVLDDALYFAGRSRTMWVYQDTSGIAEGATQDWQITAACGGELKIVLCWSDKPGALAGSGPKIKNDIDLTVQAPGGATYLGNVFTGGQSATGGSADRLNTTEVVWLRTPEAGTYAITVHYYDSLQDDLQRFSLVAVGEGVGPAGVDTEPPTAPGNAALGSDGMLTWSPSTDNVGVTGYSVYRSQAAYFEVSGSEVLGTTAGTSYSVAGSLGDPAVNYYFRVTAHDAALNESDPSATVGEHDYEMDDGS